MTARAGELVPRPKLLDLFAGAGGCSVGYHRAGFDVVGVDIEAHPDHPFPMYVADALDVLDDMLEHGDGCIYDGIEFDAIHASPPCQGYTTMNNRHGSSYPLLIDDVRERLVATGLPYVIENVSGAKRHLRNPIELTGESEKGEDRDTFDAARRLHRGHVHEDTETEQRLRSLLTAVVASAYGETTRAGRTTTEVAADAVRAASDYLGFTTHVGTP